MLPYAFLRFFYAFSKLSYAFLCFPALFLCFPTLSYAFTCFYMLLPAKAGKKCATLCVSPCLSKWLKCFGML